MDFNVFDILEEKLGNEVSLDLVSYKGTFHLSHFFYFLLYLLIIMLNPMWLLFHKEKVSGSEFLSELEKFRWK